MSTLRLGPGMYRLILATLVVIGHYSSLNLGHAAVGLFFVLSGYWITRMWYKKYSSLNNAYRTFLISRAWRLAPVFWLCSALAVICTVILPQVFVSSKPAVHLTNLQVLSSVILLGYHTIGNGVLVPAWSLDIELQFYILSPLLFWMLDRSPKIVSLIIIFVSCVSLTLCLDKTLIAYLGYFLSGVLVARYPDFILQVNLVRVSSILAILIITIFTVMPELRPVLYGGAKVSDLYVFSDSLNTIIAILAIPFTLQTITNPSSTQDKFLSDLSYSFYLFHWIPMIVMTSYFPWISYGNFVVRAIITGFILILTALASICITIFIDRPAMRARNILFG